MVPTTVGGVSKYSRISVVCIAKDGLLLTSCNNLHNSGRRGNSASYHTKQEYNDVKHSDGL